MENNTNHILRTIGAVVFLVVVIGGFVFWQRYQAQKRALVIANTPMKVEVVNTPEIAGKAQKPEGFPADLPVELTDVVESQKSNFTEQGAVQTSFTYRSKKALSEKYSEYLSYMQKSGYEVKEGSANEVKTLFGTKAGENLSITLSTWESLTVVQIAHLSF